MQKNVNIVMAGKSQITILKSIKHANVMKEFYASIRIQIAHFGIQKLGHVTGLFQVSLDVGFGEFVLVEFVDIDSGFGVVEFGDEVREIEFLADIFVFFFFFAFAF